MKRAARRLGKALAIATALSALPYLIPLPKPEERDASEFAPSDEFLPVEGLVTHYRAWGEGKPIVMIHGFWSWSFTWEPMGNLLARSGYRCVALDLKGFGLTEKPQGADYSHRSLARFVISFMDVMGIDRAALAGSSMGGNIALHAALRYPERVGGLILVAPAAFAAWGLIGSLGALAALPPLRRAMKHALRRYALSERSIRAIQSSYFDPAHVGAETIERYRLPLRTKGWDDALIGLLKASKQNSIAHRLPDVWQPTLLVWGKHDRVLPPRWAQNLALHMPHCQIQFIERAGHLPHEEQPEATARAVEAFLAAEGGHIWG